MVQRYTPRHQILGLVQLVQIWNALPIGLEDGVDGTANRQLQLVTQSNYSRKILLNSGTLIHLAAIITAGKIVLHVILKVKYHDWPSYSQSKTKIGSYNIVKCIPLFYISLDACIPYSEKTCHQVGARFNLEKGGGGFAFVGNYSVKGCYAWHSGKYAGKIFYGTGGTIKEMQALVADPKYRPQGYDCAGDLRK